MSVLEQSILVSYHLTHRGHNAISTEKFHNRVQRFLGVMLAEADILSFVVSFSSGNHTIVKQNCAEAIKYSYLLQYPLKQKPDVWGKRFDSRYVQCYFYQPLNKEKIIYMQYFYRHF